MILHWKRGVLLVVSGLIPVIAGIGFVFVLFGAPGEEDRAYIMELNGTAMIKPVDADWQSLKRGMVVTDRSRIRTGAGSWVVMYYKKTRVHLGSDTDLVIDSLTNGSGKGKISLTKGFSWIDFHAADFRNKDGGNGTLQIVTPTAVASVRGTKFSVRHDDNGTDTCVCHGEIESGHRQGEESFPVKTGESAHHLTDGASETINLSKYFDGRNIKPEFMTDEITPQRKSYRENCLHCHHLKSD